MRTRCLWCTSVQTGALNVSPRCQAVPAATCQKNTIGIKVKFRHRQAPAGRTARRRRLLTHLAPLHWSRWHSSRWQSAWSAERGGGRQIRGESVISLRWRVGAALFIKLLAGKLTLNLCNSDMLVRYFIFAVHNCCNDLINCNPGLRQTSVKSNSVFECGTSSKFETLSMDVSPAAARTSTFQGALKVSFAGQMTDRCMCEKNGYKWLQVNYCSQPSQAEKLCSGHDERAHCSLSATWQCSYYVSKCIRLLRGESAEQMSDADGVPELRPRTKRMLVKRPSPSVALFSKNSHRSSCQPVTFSSPPHSDNQSLQPGVMNFLVSGCHWAIRRRRKKYIPMRPQRLSDRRVDQHQRSENQIHLCVYDLRCEFRRLL